ncbi:hypothetical protein JNUCC31_17860 [Paenibacillus sp. JNUCC31]|nr:hypothetical protein JNUCC31_17860 [Paenibacillus sp. JNUCC-31]
MFSDGLREQIGYKGKNIHAMELCPPIISEKSYTFFSLSIVLNMLY